MNDLKKKTTYAMSKMEVDLEELFKTKFSAYSSYF